MATTSRPRPGRIGTSTSYAARRAPGGGIKMGNGYINRSHGSGAPSVVVRSVRRNLGGSYLERQTMMIRTPGKGYSPGLSRSALHVSGGAKGAAVGGAVAVGLAYGVKRHRANQRRVARGGGVAPRSGQPLTAKQRQQRVAAARAPRRRTGRR